MFTRINIAQAKQLLAQPNTQCVDTRDAIAYQQSHIANAVSLSPDNFSQWLASANKNHPVLVYCYYGISSQDAANFIAEQGFQEVYSLDGGYEAWRKASV